MAGTKTPPPPPPPPPSSIYSLGLGDQLLITGKTGNGLTINGAGSNMIVPGDNDTITLASAGNSVTVHDHAAIVINGGGNTVSLHDKGSLTINDARTMDAGVSGSIAFGDSITVHDNNAIALNYTLNLGASDVVSVNFNPLLSHNNGDTVAQNYVVNAGKADIIGFSGSNQSVLVNLGSGDTLTSSGANDYITVGGAAATKSSMTVGATASGTTIDGGLGTDTFTGGVGYDGGNHYIASAHDYIDGFNAVGSCINYSSLGTRVTVNLNTGIGTGYDASGNALWQDTYTNVQQVKASKVDGNDLTGSDTFYCELKGGLGSATYHGGGGGDRIIWGSAGATGLLDGQGTDIAYGGSGNDEFYWRNSPGGKGVSNMGETINGFSTSQGDDLNLSEFAQAGFAGVPRSFANVADDLTNWVNVALSADGSSTLVQFDKSGTGTSFQTAATLMNDNLYADYGVTDHGSAGSAQVLNDLYSAGHLVLGAPH